MIEFIKAQGYRVFVRDIHKPTYCFFTDGTRIGYAQWDTFRQAVSSVHKPNTACGTGFHISDEITASSLERTLECVYPHWASASDRRSVHKYADMDAYLKASRWNSELIEV